MHRVMIMLLDELGRRDDEPFPRQHVRVRDIRNRADVSQKSIYREVAEASDRLVRETVESWKNGEQGRGGHPIFAVCRYRSERGLVEAQFNEAARSHVRPMIQHGAEYQLRDALVLSTPYAIRVYEIAREVERARQEVEITIQEIRRMLGVEGKYDRHGDLRRRVIDPAVQEVHLRCGVPVVCRDVRDGQTPVALRWSLKHRSTHH